jgi:hypothetical protein
MHLPRSIRWLPIHLCLAGAWAGIAPAGETPPAGLVRVYSHLLEPREHPDYERRVVKPPDWDTFGRRTQFTTLRGFDVKDDRIVGYAEELERYTSTWSLGKVIWPSYPILFARNLGDLADEIKRRDLYLFDVWGYVPGSGPGGYWQQFKAPAEAFKLLEEKLGERWLGTDIGEQDGRYIGGYANQMTPASATRLEQYLNFQRHFERMSDDLGHKHATLVSLNFGHYFLKEGTYTLIGAETAQGLPNSQVYYAFIRGAGKQYGVPWFGNASIFNRWGFKTYGSSGRSDGYDHGPTKGTSLSLMKRLLYSHILYNSVAVGFENGWFDGAQLSPIGRIQQAAQRWVNETGQPGVMHTPVALMLDFFSGWSFPRHLYTDKLYRVWGNLPYEPGDFQTDAILNLLYPGYADSSYFHDESGFLVATPYGDIADCVLSDAPLWVLQRYPVLILAGDLRGGRQLRDKLQAYAEGGGQVVLTAGNLERLPGGLGGITTAPTAQAAAVLPLNYQPGKAEAIRTRGASSPSAAMRARCGRGEIIVLTSRCAVAPPSSADPPPNSAVDRPLVSPWRLLPEAREVVDGVLRKQMLFEADPRLALITCRKGPGDYVIGLFNNQWKELPLALRSHIGPIESMHELALDTSEKTAAGYTPESVDTTGLGSGGTNSIAGGDVRLLAVRVRETGVEEIAHTKPTGRTRSLLLPLRAPRSIKEEVLARPEFFEHFEGVVVPWTYLDDRESAALEREAGWIKRQGLRIVVDLSSGVDLYPTLRLINNLPADYEANLQTVTNVLHKMEVVGARDLLLSLHRHPENNFSDEQTRAAFESTLGKITKEAATRQITVHLRMAFGKPPWNLEESLRLLDRVGAPNLRIAPSTALLIAASVKPENAGHQIKGRAGFWLAAAPRKDSTGHLWDAHGQLHLSADTTSVLDYLKSAPDLPVILDAVYGDQDEEYGDAAFLNGNLGAGSR